MEQGARCFADPRSHATYRGVALFVDLWLSLLFPFTDMDFRMTVFIE
jgi:hypothetical protein